MVKNDIFFKQFEGCNSTKRCQTWKQNTHAHFHITSNTSTKFQINWIKTVREVIWKRTSLIDRRTDSFIPKYVPSKDACIKTVWQGYTTNRKCRPRWLSWMRRATGDQKVAGSTLVEVGNILSWRSIMKYFLRSFSLLLIQEGQLSFSGEKMCTILVNRPVNVWLGKLTALDMTPLG